MNLSNKFLISLPTIPQGSFHKSLVYVNEHTGDGAHGWIVNQQLEDSTATKLRNGMKLNLNCPVFYGGPVDVNSAYIIHSKDFHIPSTISLNNDLSLTRDKAVIDILNIGQYPEYWRLVVGSSTWGSGQLESEILGSRTNGVSSWSYIDFTTKLMWNTLPSEQWNTGIEKYAEHMTKNILKVSNM